MNNNTVVIEDAIFNINKALAVGVLLVGDPDADTHVVNAASLICDELKRAKDTLTPLMGLSAEPPRKRTPRTTVAQPPRIPVVAPDAAQMQHD